MITLLWSLVADIDFGVVLGYILMALEILIVIITLLKFFVPANSKFGKILSSILKGLHQSKDYIEDIDDTKKDKEE